MPSGVTNGKLLSPIKRAKVIELLCAGESINQVSKATGVHWLTVRAVQWANAAKVEERKQILAERSEHAAADALDLLHAKLIKSGPSIPPSALVPIFGVLVDKALALRADPTIQVSHSHQHIHAHISPASYSDLLSRLPSRATTSDQPTPSTIINVDAVNPPNDSSTDVLKKD